MATNFPTSLDSLTNPTATDTLDSPPHDTQHADANDAIEAIQAKVGIDSSAVTTSLDYRVGQLELGGGSMTTSSSAPSSPSDGDMWYDTDDGRTYVYYDDGTSQQWVEFGAPAVAHGKILQVVSTTKTDTFSASISATWTDVTGLNVSITPTSATSKILITVDTPLLDNSVSGGQTFLRVTRDGTAIGVGDAAGSRTQIGFGHIVTQTNRPHASSFQYLDSPASTSALDYQVEAWALSSSVYINRVLSTTDSNVFPRSSATITAWEVSA